MPDNLPLICWRDIVEFADMLKAILSDISR